MASQSPSAGVKTTDEGRYQRVSTADRRAIVAWREGISLESHFSCTVQELMVRVTRDRLSLSHHFLESADKMTRLRPALPRVAVGRYYYSMYHAVRAVVYFTSQGDIDDHSNLPKHLPSDFSNSTYWENQVKLARTYRNEADYDPYPLSDQYFKSAMSQLQTDAHDLYNQSRTYLATKGV